jgi:hypothetical protein
MSVRLRASALPLGMAAMGAERTSRLIRGYVRFPPLADVRDAPFNLAGVSESLTQVCMIDDARLPGGVVHGLPDDFEVALKCDAAALATWHAITPLARNEWVCWVSSAKKAETREKRIRWGCESLSEGKRRPCCWPGCSHR